MPIRSILQRDEAGRMEYFYSAVDAGMIWKFDPTGMVMWLDAQTLAGSNGSDVITWVTRFPGDIVFTSARTDDKNPVLYTGNINYVDWYNPTYPHDDKYFGMPADSRIDSDLAVGQGYFFLMKQTADMGYKYLIGQGNIYIWASVNAVDSQFNSVDCNATGLDLSDWSVLSVINRPGQQLVRVNGTTVATASGSPAGLHVDEGMVIGVDTGQGVGFEGALTDFIYINKYPTDSNITTIEAYLLKKRAKILA